MIVGERREGNKGRRGKKGTWGKRKEWEGKMGNGARKEMEEQ